MKAPSVPIVRQGKWECAAACLSQLTGVPMFHVKRAMGKAGWRNDEKGASERVSREAARAHGFDLVWLPRKALDLLLPNLPDAILTVPSLNYKGAFHGVTWLNGEVIDPNFGDPNRRYWGADATFEEMGLRSATILVRRPLDFLERDEFEFYQKRKSYQSQAEFVRAVLENRKMWDNLIGKVV